MQNFNSYSNSNLNSWFISGLVDGEGSFMIKFIPNTKFKLGYQVQAAFNLTMHIRDTELLSLIKDFFGVGSICKNLKHNSVDYRVTKFEDL